MSTDAPPAPAWDDLCKRMAALIACLLSLLKQLPANQLPETVEEIVGLLAALPPDQGTSMLFDRLAGRRLEWEARNGVITRLGAHHAIPTSVSDRVTAQLAALDS